MALLGLIAALIAVLTPIYNVVQFSYRVALIPDALQGRVNSTFRLIAFGLGPVGAALSGVLLERFDAGPTVAFFASWYFLLAALTSLNTTRSSRCPSRQGRCGLIPVSIASRLCLSILSGGGGCAILALFFWQH